MHFFRKIKNKNQYTIFQNAQLKYNIKSTTYEAIYSFYFPSPISQVLSQTLHRFSA